MMFRAATFVVLFGATGALAQAPIAIQSGEHDTFTRLVLTIDPARNWALVPTENNWEFRLSGGAVNFNIDDIFARIPRNRLAAASVRRGETEGVLVLNLACACEITAFAFQGRYVVLDIAALPDGAEPVAEQAARSADAATPSRHASPQLFQHDMDVGAPVIAQLSIASMTAPAITARTHPTDAETASTPSHDGHLTVQTVANNAPVDLAASTDMPRGSDEDMATPPTMTETELRVAEAQAALMEQLTRAAEQGLIDFVQAEPEATPEPEPAPAPEIVIFDEPDPMLTRQITATTVYDRDGSSALADIVNTFARTHCIEDTALNIAAWGGDGGFNDQLPVLHSAMVEERDRPLPEAAENLARFYVRYGLGREALTMLQAYDIQVASPVLFELAQIADGIAPPPGGVLDRGQGCGGAHEMWRLIGLSDLPEPPNAEVESILAAFAELPVDLRSQLAPKLGQAFIQRAQPEIALRVLGLANRAGLPPSDAMRLLGARLNLQIDPTAAEAELAALIAENSEIAPEAMVLWASALHAQGALAPETLVQSLGAAAFERRGTTPGRDLRLAEINARAGTKGFAEALDLVVGDLGHDPLADADLHRVAADILQAARPDVGRPAHYVETVLKHTTLIPPGREGDALRRTLAENMLGLALPDIALTLLGDAPARDLQAQLLAAQAELALFAPQSVLDRLETREDAAAFELIAAAHTQLGNHGAALEALSRAGAADEPRAAAAFLAGAWSQVDGVAPQENQDLARYMAQRGTDSGPESTALANPAEGVFYPMPAEQPNTLVAARATLEANRASRAYLDSLLNPTDVAPEN